MERITVGITCIGSGVGQAIVDSCNLSPLPIRTVGFGSNPLAFGQYDCDRRVLVPLSVMPEYPELLLRECIEHEVELLIPGHDEDALILSRLRDSFAASGIDVLVADFPLVSLCRDKKRMAEHLARHSLYIDTYTKEEAQNALAMGALSFPLIAKPLNGYASRGVSVLLADEDVSRIPQHYVVQPALIPGEEDPNRETFLRSLAKGQCDQVSELSIQLLAQRDGVVVGRMATVNQLSRGVPVEIVPYSDPSLWPPIDALIPELVRLGLRGPLNLQGRMTSDGLKLFEMNARFTGISALRAKLGFPEVEYCIKHWKTGEPMPQLRSNTRRFGVRQVADRAIAFSIDSKPLSERAEMRPAVLVTGSTGDLGRGIVRALGRNGGWRVATLDRDSSRAIELHGDLAEASYDWTDLDRGAIAFGHIDRICHLAFARPHNSPEEVAESLERTCRLFDTAVRHGVAEIVSVSSQSVYGHIERPPWSESSRVAPESFYAQAKYATELFLQTLGNTHRWLRHISLRLASVTGPGMETEAHEAVRSILTRLLAGETVSIYGGGQLLERIDIRDAVEAISKVLQSESGCWPAVCNLGSGKRHSLSKIAEEALLAALKAGAPSTARIETLPAVQTRDFGMNCSLFFKRFDWRPRYGLADTVRDMASALVPNAFAVSTQT